MESEASDATSDDWSFSVNTHTIHSVQHPRMNRLNVNASGNDNGWLITEDGTRHDRIVTLW